MSGVGRLPEERQATFAARTANPWRSELPAERLRHAQLLARFVRAPEARQHLSQLAMRSRAGLAANQCAIGDGSILQLALLDLHGSELVVGGRIIRVLLDSILHTGNGLICPALLPENDSEPGICLGA